MKLVMEWDVHRRLRRLLLGLSLATAVGLGPSQAQTVYRVVDETGKVTYTDNPERGGEAIILAPLPSVERASPGPAAAPVQSRPGQPFMPYDRFVIENPTSGALINDAMTPVEVRVEPPLRDDHQIRLLVNGEISQSALHSDAFWLTGLPQGSHRLYAELLDSQGRVQHRTEAVSISVAPR